MTPALSDADCNQEMLSSAQIWTHTWYCLVQLVVSYVTFSTACSLMLLANFQTQA